MSMCRTCLKTPADKHILELEKDIDCNKDSFHIMVFCLDIKVSEDSKITMNLCNNCYRKIISLYKFKALSLKNDAYLKSLDPGEQFEDHQLSLYVDENGIKHENFLDPDEFGPNLVENCDKEFKIEIDVKEGEDVEINVKEEEELKNVESDEEPLNKVQKVKYENAEDDSKRNATIKKKRGRPKKLQSEKTKEPLSKVQKVKYKNIKNDSKRNTTVKKKLGRPKKPQSEKIKEELLVCEECGKSVRCLKAHSVLHQPKGERPVFHCKLCPKFFVTESGLTRHHKNVHLGTSRSHKTKSMCEICNKEVKHLNNHIQMMHKRETLPFGCVTCERRFFSRSALQLHMTRHVDVKSEEIFQDAGSDEEPLSVVKKLKCDDVKENAPVFKKRKHSKKAKLPKQTKIKQEQQVCEECGKSVRNLKEHSLQHQPQDQQAVKCEACPKYFVTRQRQRRHYKYAHASALKSQCDICKKEVRDVKTHKMMIHYRETLPYGCVSCKRRYLYRSALETHMTSHTNELPYECDLCQKRFRSKTQVSIHIRLMHLQEKNFQCEFCSKTFFGKSSFEQHSRTHVKDRLYKCEECGLALKTIETLKKHRAVHSGVKKFHCTLCTKTFRLSGILKSHILTHTKEKPFQCQFCDMRFRQTHHLRRHEFSLHKKLGKAE